MLMRHFEKQRETKKRIAFFKSIMTVSMIIVGTFGALFFVTNIVEHFNDRTTTAHGASSPQITPLSPQEMILLQSYCPPFPPMYYSAATAPPAIPLMTPTAPQVNHENVRIFLGALDVYQRARVQFQQIFLLASSIPSQPEHEQLLRDSITQITAGATELISEWNTLLSSTDRQFITSQCPDINSILKTATTVVHQQAACNGHSKAQLTSQQSHALPITGPTLPTHLSPFETAHNELEEELKKRWTNESLKSIMDKAIEFTGLVPQWPQLPELAPLKQTQSDLMTIEREQAGIGRDHDGHGRKIRRLNCAIKQFEQATDFYQECRKTEDHNIHTIGAIIQYAATSALSLSARKRSATDEHTDAALAEETVQKREEQTEKTKDMVIIAQKLYSNLKQNRRIESQEQDLERQEQELHGLFKAAKAHDFEGRHIRFRQ